MKRTSIEPTSEENCTSSTSDEDGCCRAVITAEMTVDEVLCRFPRCGVVFQHFGLNCCACANSDVDTVGAIARALGHPVGELLRELNIAAQVGPSNTAVMMPLLPLLPHKEND